MKENIKGGRNIKKPPLLSKPATDPVKTPINRDV
jgi:hypothetical protein